MPALKKYYFHIGQFGKRLVAVTLLASCVASPVIAQQAGVVETPQMKKTNFNNLATTAFAKGDYATAITNFVALLALADKDDMLEAVYFYLGASYFNTQDYSKAIDTLKKFETLYPHSQRLAEVLFTIGQAELLNGDNATAIQYLKRVQGVPAFYELSLYYQGVANKADNKPDDAIANFEQLINPEIRSATSANGAILLVELYAKKKDFEKASALVQQLHKKMAFVDNLMNLNAQAIELGDGCMEDELPDEALLCYRLVRSRDEVIAFQTQKLQDMQQKIDQNMAAIHTDPAHGMALNAQNNQLRYGIVAGKKILEAYKKSEDIEPGVLFRIGRAYYKSHKLWESIVAYGELLQKFPDDKTYEPTLFAITVSSAEANRPLATRQFAEEYVKKFPDGKNLAPVSYLVGAAMMQAEDWDGAAMAFSAVIKAQPTNPYKEEMEFQLGNAHFASGKFDQAIKDYTQYKTDYPTGKHIEEDIYRTALSQLFNGQYEDAMAGVTDYLTNYPKGFFVADAKYRLGVCQLAAQLYPEVIAGCREWEKAYPKNPQLGEVLALLADALASTDKDDEAIQIYIRSGQVAISDETLEYALSSAEKLLQKKGDWEQIGKMYEDFVKEHPNNNMVVTAAYWIGKSMVHTGKGDEAKKFIADTIRKYIDDPHRDAVDQLLSQLAQLCIRKKKPPTPSPSPAPAVASGTSAVAVATPIPTPAPTVAPAAEEADTDPGAELDALLGSAEQDASPTAKARILFAKAQLAFMRRQIPEEEKNYATIADKFKPEDLSAVILAMVGDYLMFKGQTDKAQAYYQYLLDEFPKSDVLDYAYNGLAQIDFDKKEYEKALKLYNDAVDKGAAAQKFKDLTIGKARTLLAMNRYDDAKKVFEEVASNRDWRGPLTAESLCSLGDIEEKQNKYPEAIAYYQRVFVAYQRFLPWVAKAYIASGDCFEKMGKIPEAINTYQEMLRNEKLQSFPEADVARKRLEVLGG